VPLESTDGLWQPSERLLDPLGAHLRTSSSFVLFFGVISLLVLAFDLHLFLRLGLSLSLSFSLLQFVFIFQEGTSSMYIRPL